jgi:hypothetical protein
MSLQRIERMQAYIDKLQLVYDEYKRDTKVPEGENVTILLTPEQIQILKDVFVVGMQKAIADNDRDKYFEYERLYEDIYFQVAAELV